MTYTKEQVIDTDGQVIDKFNGIDTYYLNNTGYCHRVGGPAVIKPDGTVEY
jgi:hypothetical protein